MKRKKKTNTTNKILIILGIFILSFITTMIIIFCRYGSIPDTLVQCVLGGSGFEALFLAAIKITKILKGENVE